MLALLGPRRRLSIAVAALVAAVVSIPAAARAETKLEWRFQPGETLHYTLNQEMNQEIGVGGMSIKVSGTQTMDISWSVKSVESGVASVVQMIERARIRMSQQGLSMEYDSAAEKEPEGLAKMVAPMFQALVKKPISMKIDRRGELSEVVVPQEMLDQLKKTPGMEQVSSMFSEEGLRQMIGLAGLPPEPIAPGKTWTRESSMSVPIFGKQQVQTMFKYEGSQRRDGREIEAIGSTAKIKFVPDDKQPAKFDIQDQDNRGTIYFDNASGRMVESDAKIKIKATVTVAGNTFDQDMEIQIAMKLEPAAKQTK